jgi:hypothetical protein
MPWREIGPGSSYYHYYHCIPECGARFKTESANAEFVKELREYVPRRAMINIYGELIIKPGSYQSTSGRSESDRVEPM